MLEIDDVLQNKIDLIIELKKDFNDKTELLKFNHYERDYIVKGITTDWFDLNITDKVAWFIFKEDRTNKYKQIKLENTDDFKRIKNKKEGI